MKRVPNVVGAMALGAALAGCSGGGGGETAVPKAEKLCEAPVHASVGVVPFDDEVGSKLQLAGADDLLMTSMVENGCFSLLEREALELLVEELRLCSPDNLDRGFFDCGKEGEDEASGQLKLVETLVLGKLTFFEPEVEGAALKLKIPEVGGIVAGTSYTALAFNLRAVRVKTRDVVAALDLHTVIQSTEAGIDIEEGGFALGASGFQRTRLGIELTKMMQQGAARLHESLAKSPPPANDATVADEAVKDEAAKDEAAKDEAAKDDAAKDDAAASSEP